ncbi:MAG: 50S ribosomal protein L1 [Phycisphaerales bacterium]|nr:50S ribosomal protein L1 [Phycisphaerales bacterium]
MTKRGKADAALVLAEAVEAPEALAAVKKFTATKFDQSVEICMHLGVDVKHADQMVRGSVSLPKGIGKSKNVIAFCAPEHVKDALAAGAVEAGGDELVSKVKGGWFDFDVAIASPDMMRVMSVLGKVLGPKGLMPSPKNGTVTPKVADAVKDFAAGKLEYRADKGGNVHAIIGKMSFSEADLLENYNHFVTTIEKARPSTVKGQYVKKITLSGTMTPGVQVAIVSDEE